jgi:hypothetical protein
MSRWDEPLSLFPLPTVDISFCSVCTWYLSVSNLLFLLFLILLIRDLGTTGKYSDLFSSQRRRYDSNHDLGSITRSPPFTFRPRDPQHPIMPPSWAHRALGATIGLLAAFFPEADAAVAASSSSVTPHSRTPSSCPDYTTYAQERHEPYSDGPLKLPYMRPSPECRTFNSSAVEVCVCFVYTYEAEAMLLGEYKIHGWRWLTRSYYRKSSRT